MCCVSDSTKGKDQERKRGRRHLSPALWQVRNNFPPVFAELCALRRGEASAALGVIGYGSVRMKYFIAVRFPAWTDRGVRSPNIYWSNCHKQCPSEYCVWGTVAKKCNKRHEAECGKKWECFFSLFWKPSAEVLSDGERLPLCRLTIWKHLWTQSQC